MRRRQFLSIVTAGGAGTIAGCSSDDRPDVSLGAIETTNRLEHTVTVELTIDSVTDDRSYDYSGTVGSIDTDPGVDRLYVVEPDIENVYDFEYGIQVEEVTAEQSVPADYLRDNYAEEGGDGACLLLHWSIRDPEEIGVFVDVHNDWCDG